MLGGSQIWGHDAEVKALEYKCDLNNTLHLKGTSNVWTSDTHKYPTLVWI
jgi:hypothetical protein